MRSLILLLVVLSSQLSFALTVNVDGQRPGSYPFAVSYRSADEQAMFGLSCQHKDQGDWFLTSWQFNFDKHGYDQSFYVDVRPTGRPLPDQDACVSFVKAIDSLINKNGKSTIVVQPDSVTVDGVLAK